jgi:SAM-dependent methyltransferase
MNGWIYKALFYKILSCFPPSFQKKISYFIRRNYGQLKSPIRTYGLSTTEDLFERIKQQKIAPKDKVFFELGTGWVPYTSIYLSLMGAKKVYTLDLDNLIKNEIVFELLEIILNKIDKKLRSNLDQSKVKKLKKFKDLKKFSYLEVFRALDIVYLPKSNPKNINIDNNSIDFYYSRSVFEHIPSKDLIDIISEGRRLLKPNGLFISKIDLSDHFANKNNLLSQINFLKYSKATWNFLSKNNFSYANRLRISDFKEYFESLNMSLLNEDNVVSQKIVKQLQESKFKVHKDFWKYDLTELATTSSWLIFKKKI